MITVSEEKSVDYELTARIAAEAFGSKGGNFSAERMRWLYQRSFGEGSAILAVFDEGIKVGQIGLIHQTSGSNGKSGIAVIILVELFILQSYRSAQSVRRIYRRLSAFATIKKCRCYRRPHTEGNRHADQRTFSRAQAPCLVADPRRCRTFSARPFRAEIFGMASNRSTRPITRVICFRALALPRTDNGLSWNDET